jgi:hypothetical protein
MQYVVVDRHGELHVIKSIGLDDAPNMYDMDCSSEVTGYAQAILAVKLLNNGDLILTKVKTRGQTTLTNN